MNMDVVVERNVLGGRLASCSTDPMTGVTRDGCCSHHPLDRGKHLVCAVVTRDFLDFTRNRGNDLSTPRPEFGFSGLEPGDRWCLCVDRWIEARDCGVAPPVDLNATHQSALASIPLADLKVHSIVEGRVVHATVSAGGFARGV